MFVFSITVLFPFPEKEMPCFVMVTGFFCYYQLYQLSEHHNCKTQILVRCYCTISFYMITQNTATFNNLSLELDSKWAISILIMKSEVQNICNYCSRHVIFLLATYGRYKNICTIHTMFITLWMIIRQWPSSQMMN